MANTNGQQTYAKMLNIISNQKNKHFKRYHFCPVWQRLPSLPTVKIQQ